MLELLDYSSAQTLFSIPDSPSIKTQMIMQLVIIIVYGEELSRSECSVLYYEFWKKNCKTLAVPTGGQLYRCKIFVEHC